MAPSIAAAQSAGGQAACKAGETRKPDGTCAPGNANQVSEVVVTGSRIHRSEYNSASPIQVINADTASLEGLTNTADILRTSSLVAGSAQVNNLLTGFVVTGGPGADTVSLRGLGANRTLVLVDGHRLGPAGVRGRVGPVDLNVLPGSIIDHVEILKDGASSIYGSDAVAGVVNVITKKNLDGGIINVFGDATQYGGGNQYDVNAAWGKVWDHGYFNVAADYSDQEVLRRGQRPGTACSDNYLFDAADQHRISNPGAAIQCSNLFADVIRTSLGDLIYPDSGVIYPTPTQGNSTASGAPIPDGLVRQARGGFPATWAYAHFGQTSPLYSRASLISPDKLYSLNARGGFDFGANTELYYGLLLNKRDSKQFSDRQFFPNFSTANPNNPFGGSLGSLLPIIPLKFDTAQQDNYFNAYAGLRGKFISGWDWDIRARASSSVADYQSDNIFNDAVLAVTGSAACNPAKLLTISGRSCSQVPGGIPLLNPAELSGVFTPAESAFLFGTIHGKTTFNEQELEATTTGDLFSLPAGKVGVALGVDFRHQHLDDRPDPNEQAGNLWGLTSAGETAGSQDIREVYGEIDVPLVKGVPFIESLDLQASERYTDYSLSGSNSTYKVGLNWHMNSWLALRGTVGTSFRAPQLYELFLANQTSFANQVGLDPCIHWELNPNNNIKTNCQAAGVPSGYSGAGTSSALITTGGGAGHLKAENSRANTLGVVFTPSFLDFSMAVDYTDLVVSNEVAQFGSANIAFSCYNSSSFPTDPFCSLVKRAGFQGVPFNPGNPNPQITAVNNSFVNISTQVQRDIDVTARYRHDFDFGRLQVDTQLTWDLERATRIFPGGALHNYLGTNFNLTTGAGPSFNGITNVRFEHGPWTGLWTIQMIGAFSDLKIASSSSSTTQYSSMCQVGAGPVAPCTSLIGTGPLTVIPTNVFVKRTGAMTTYHTLSLRRTLDTWVFQAGVQNIANQAPPNVSTGEFRAGTSALNGWDYYGRRFFMNVTKKF